MSALEICQRIVAIDAERRELEAALFRETGQSFGEFMAGMTRLLAPVDVSAAEIDRRAEAWRESDR